MRLPGRGDMVLRAQLPRAYREGRLPDKPPLLQIFQSTDCLTYFKMHLEYAVNMAVRPKRMPHQALVIGSVMPKRPRPALDVADLADDGRRRVGRRRGCSGSGAAQQFVWIRETA